MTESGAGSREADQHKHVMTPLPCAECGGRCCDVMPATEWEFQRIVAAHPLPTGAIALQTPTRLLGPGRLVMMPGGGCPYLVRGRCSIYEDRPLVCRDYGIIADLPCVYLYPAAAAYAVNRQRQKGMEGNLGLQESP
jgi:Fe-S-cluster containining protein